MYLYARMCMRKMNKIAKYHNFFQYTINPTTLVKRYKSRVSILKNMTNNYYNFSKITESKPYSRQCSRLGDRDSNP